MSNSHFSKSATSGKAGGLKQYGSKPFGPSGHPRALAAMGTRSAVGSSASPSPRPSPPRRGGNVSRDGANLCVSQLPSRSRGFPLSLAALARRRSRSGERAGVRGNRATFVSLAEPFPGTVKLDESPGRAGGFPRRMTISSMFSRSDCGPRLRRRLPRARGRVEKVVWTRPSAKARRFREPPRRALWPHSRRSA